MEGSRICEGPGETYWFRLLKNHPGRGAGGEREGGKIIRGAQRSRGRVSIGEKRKEKGGMERKNRDLSKERRRKG